MEEKKKKSKRGNGLGSEIFLGESRYHLNQVASISYCTCHLWQRWHRFLLCPGNLHYPLLGSLRIIHLFFFYSRLNFSFYRNTILSIPILPCYIPIFVANFPLVKRIIIRHILYCTFIFVVCSKNVALVGFLYILVFISHSTLRFVIFFRCSFWIWIKNFYVVIVTIVE